MYVRRHRTYLCASVHKYVPSQKPLRTECLLSVSLQLSLSFNLQLSLSFNLQLSFASGVLVYFSYGLHHSTLNVPRHVTHARTTEDAVALLDILDANTDDDS